MLLLFGIYKLRRRKICGENYVSALSGRSISPFCLNHGFDASKKVGVNLTYHSSGRKQVLPGRKGVPGRNDRCYRCILMHQSRSFLKALSLGGMINPARKTFGAELRTQAMFSTINRIRCDLTENYRYSDTLWA